jgi:hypothetical protein
MLDIFPLSYSSVFPLFSLVRAKKIVDAKCSFLSHYISQNMKEYYVFVKADKKVVTHFLAIHIVMTLILDCKNGFDAHVDG